MQLVQQVSQWDDPMVVLTWWLVVWAGLQVLILVLQSILFWQTIKLTRSDQRAWIAPIKIASTRTLDDPKGLSVQVTWANPGKTPALEFRTIVSLESLPAHRTFAPKYDWSQATSTSVLFPGSDLYSDVSLLPEDYSAKAIRSGAQLIYFYGACIYRDAFSREHHTLFAVMLDPTRRVWNVPPSITMPPSSCPGI